MKGLGPDEADDEEENAARFDLGVERDDSSVKNKNKKNQSP